MTKVPKVPPGRRELRAIPTTDETVVERSSAEIRFAGYAAVYERPSEWMGFTEFVAPGAFEAILATNPDVRMLGMNHDPGHVLCRTRSGTLILSSDARGLAFEARCARTGYSEEIAAGVQRGDIDAMSYGFACEKEIWDETDPENITRTIVSYRALYDISPVAFAAFTATLIEARSLGQKIVDGAISPAELRAIMQVNVWTDDEPATEELAIENEPAATDDDGMSHRNAAALRERRRRLLLT